MRPIAGAINVNRIDQLQPAPRDPAALAGGSYGARLNRAARKSQVRATQDCALEPQIERGDVSVAPAAVGSCRKRAYASTLAAGKADRFRHASSDVRIQSRGRSVRKPPCIRVVVHNRLQRRLAACQVQVGSTFRGWARLTDTEIWIAAATINRSMAGRDNWTRPRRWPIGRHMRWLQHLGRGLLRRCQTERVRRSPQEGRRGRRRLRQGGADGRQRVLCPAPHGL